MLRFFFVFLFSIYSFSTVAIERSDQKLRVLYNSLDPRSVAQHLAFYELYSQKSLGQRAWRDAWFLLSGDQRNVQQNYLNIPLSPSSISAIISLVNKSADSKATIDLKKEDLFVISQLSKRLSHHQLKGHSIYTEREMLQLPSEQIDLGRAILLSQPDFNLNQLQLYEATLDLMALQILARLPQQATAEEKIQAMNQFIFEEMSFRFPPHSLYAKEIDHYTFLPSVLDSHRGVCLGVSILYLCLAQRLDLKLEMITPPGHIYVRYVGPNKEEINIETTARGIHRDSEDYLTIDTRSLQQRNIKEVIGLAHMNQAAMYWQKNEFEKALYSYRRALPYLPDDMFLKELLGYMYLFTGQNEMGRQLLDQVKDYLPEYSINKNTVAEDFLAGRVDAEGIKAAYKHVDEDRESVLEKKRQLEETVKKYPHFRAGVFHLAVTWLQLHRMREALTILEQYHTIHPQDPEANYYLTVLYSTRLDYNNAWKHLHLAEELTQKHNYKPKLLKDVRKGLTACCPE